MADQGNTTQETTGAWSNFMPVDLAATWKQYLDEFVNVQKELLQELQETNQYWADRGKAETDFAADFVTKLPALRSVPESRQAYQDWFRQRMEMAADDGKHLLSDSQKLMATSARLFSNSRTNT